MKPVSMEQRAEARARLAERVAAAELGYAEAIREMRKALGRTQAEFAAMLHMDLKQLAQIERGKANPTVDTLSRIGKLFGFRVGFVPNLRRPPPPEVSEVLRAAKTETAGLPAEEIRKLSEMLQAARHFPRAEEMQKLAEVLQAVKHFPTATEIRKISEMLKVADKPRARDLLAAAGSPEISGPSEGSTRRRRR